MSVIVVDAGHGGHDPGAVNGGRLEKDDTLRQALAVGRLLQNAGQRVIYTRTTDTFLSLAERARISNNACADFFLSLHRNGSTNANARGVDNFVRQGAPPQLIACAVNMLSNVVRQGVSADRGTHQANFQVLRDTMAPAVLMETLFITNNEDNLLFDRNFDAYNRAIADGVLQCLGHNTPTAPPAGDVAVRLIQSTLNTRYNTGLTVDGIAGPLTRRALVTGLQRELNSTFNAGLTVDGVFGASTRAVVPLVRMGSRGNIVWLIQAALLIRGFRTEPDGIFGPNTDNMVRQFQRSSGLSVDGIVGPNTFERLFAG